MNRFLRAVLATFAGCLAIFARAEPVPVRAFFEPPTFSLLKLSPDGLHLAMLSTLQYREYIFLLDLRTLKSVPLGSVEQNDHVTNYWWKGDDILLLEVERNFGTSLRALNVLTKKVTPLNAANELRLTMVHSLPTDPNNVMVSAYNATGYGADLRRMDVRTGKLTVIEHGKLDVSNWIANDKGEPVAAFGQSGDNWFMLTRGSPGADWVRQPLGSDFQPDFLPVSVHMDQRRLVGWDYNTGDTARVVILDPITGTKEVLFQSAEVDPDSLQLWTDDLTHPMAVNYETDQAQRAFLDANAAALMTKIDGVLPGRLNTVVSESKTGSLAVILSSSDHQRGEYYLLDKATGHISALGGNNGSFAGAALSPGRFFRFGARDGLPLSGRIILPAAGTKKPPLVLKVGPYFNGPRARDQFDREDQLLASRGYAVARINWRGVAGFGRSFVKAGDKEITKGMPNDLEDGVRWLQAQGWVGEQAGVLGYGAGGLLALQLAGRSPLFSVWLNFRSPMSFQNYDSGDYILSEHKATDIPAQFGGRWAAWKYVKSLDKDSLPAAVRIPAFHYYFSKGTDQKRAVAYSKEANQPYVSLIGRDLDHNRAANDENFLRTSTDRDVEIYTQLMDFLQKYLPVDHAAPPAKP